MSSAEIFDGEFVARLEVLARRQQERRAGSGAEQSHGAGRGGHGEIAGSRPYASGDDLRDLDWAFYARHERLQVRERERERGGESIVILDRSASMAAGGERKWKEARRLAGALSYLAVRASHSVRFVWSEGEREVALGRLDRTERFLSWAQPLARLALAPPAASARASATPSAGAVLLRQSHRPSGEGALVVVSDFLDALSLRPQMVRARENGWQVLAAQTLDHQELTPGLGPALVRDLESGAEFQIEIDDDVRARYENEIGQEIEEWRRFCGRHQITHLFMDADVGALATLERARAAPRVVA